MPTKKMSNAPHNDHLNQGGTGAFKTRKSGSKLDQNPGHKKGKGISQKGGKIPAVVSARGSTGSHLTPFPAKTRKTAEKQGGTIFGHDSVNPTAGKSKSGSKFDQQPSLKK